MAKPGKDHDAYDLALKALGYKERTESELRAWLAQRRVGQTEVDEVMALLAEAGAIDDASFARRYAEDKRQLAGWGPVRIRESLEGRGVAPEHIDAALDGDGEEDQLQRALVLLQGRQMACASEPERDRALRLLVRRGYPLELAYEAVRVAERASARAA